MCVCVRVSVHVRVYVCIYLCVKGTWIRKQVDKTRSKWLGWQMDRDPTYLWMRESFLVRVASPPKLSSLCSSCSPKGTVLSAKMACPLMSPLPWIQVFVALFKCLPKKHWSEHFIFLQLSHKQQMVTSSDSPLGSIRGSNEKTTHWKSTSLTAESWS